MPHIDIITNGDGAWPDLRNNPNLVEGTLEAVAFLDKGMVSGLPSVYYRIRLSDGKIVLAQTSGRITNSIAVALNAKFPDLLKD